MDRWDISGNNFCSLWIEHNTLEFNIDSQSVNQQGDYEYLCCESAGDAAELTIDVRDKSITDSEREKWREAASEVIELDDNYFDTVLMTYTMCTIPNLSQALSEIKRVMKTDGRLVFCEHGASPEQQVFKWQNRVNNVWSKIAGGCNINKNIPSIIESSGLIISQMETMYLPKTPKILGYNYWGSAVLDD